MTNETIRQKVLNFLDLNELGVISTIHTDKPGPESAVVGFGNTEELELIFGTSIKSRKYRNIQTDPHVSFVIGWSSTLGSVQYEGIARELSDKELDHYLPFHLKKNELRKKFVSQADQRYFVVQPTWIRLLDNAGNPPDVFEINF